MTSTLSVISEPSSSSRRWPLLYLVLESKRPLAGSARWSLAEVDEVQLGRGDERGSRREIDEGVHRLRISVPDKRASSLHARVVRVGSRWAVEDLESKNGTLVNGVPEKRRTLADGDLLETGETLWLFREEPGPDTDPGDLDAETLADTPEGLRTVSPELQTLFGALSDVAGSAAAIRIRGATGTGKELVARAIHARSGRRGRLVAVNCGALPAALVESELFGSRRGAFSGASEDRVGLVRSADNGTLFLDEIGDLPAAGQPALLRLIQEREVVPVGDTRPVPVDFRVVAATHRDLEALVARGAFRADLLARLSGFQANLPTLRERRADLGLLVAALLRRLAPAGREPTFSVDASRAIVRHDWPNNIRELEQSLVSALALARGGPIEHAHLPASVRSGPRPSAQERDPSEFDPADRALRDDLARLLAEHEGNISAVARAMGKDRTQVRRWVERLGLDDVRRRS